MQIYKITGKLPVISLILGFKFYRGLTVKLLTFEKSAKLRSNIVYAHQLRHSYNDA